MNSMNGADEAEICEEVRNRFRDDSDGRPSDERKK